jgi:hypothetical protein
MEKVFITQEELKKIQEMNSEFNKAKSNLGELELQKQSIIRHIDSMKVDFLNHERMLIDRYGSDSVINIQTGEVTKKENS